MINAEFAAVILIEHINHNYETFFPMKTIKTHEKFIFRPSKELLQEMRIQERLYIENLKSYLRKSSPTILTVVGVKSVLDVLDVTKHGLFIRYNVIE